MHNKTAPLFAVFALCFFTGLLFLLCLLLFATPAHQKKRAGEEYAALASSLREEAPQDVRKPAAKEEAAEAAAEVETTSRTGEDLPGLSADAWETLVSTNESAVGILRFPVLHFSYPIAQGKDNTTYLDTTFAGTPSPAGSVFLDAGASPDLTDRNSFLFAHNMADGSMFGSLKTLGENRALTDSAPSGIYFRIAGKERTLAYRVIGFRPVGTGDESFYCRISSDADYDAWLASALEGSWYDPGEGALAKTKGERPDLVILSTCYGTGHTENFAVIGARWERACYNEPDIATTETIPTP